MATLRKRGNYQWEAQIRKRGYAPQSKTFNTKAEADAWARLVESEMTLGVFLSNGEAETTTLAEALERYWHKVASLKRYPDRERGFINRWLRHPYACRFLAQLRSTDWAAYRDDRRAQGKAENTIRIELALISHLYEIARREWGMEGLMNPVQNIRKPSGSLEWDRRLKAGEYELIVAELKNSRNPWVCPLFEFAVESSLRQGMLLKLRWEWVNWDGSFIDIPIEFRSIGNKGVPGKLRTASSE